MTARLRHTSSTALTVDRTSDTKYRYASWNIPECDFARSPLFLVGQVETQAMILTGEADYRTPIAESEQYYPALKLRGLDTVLVRIPGASHGITARTSQMMSKVAHVLAWFERHGGVAE